MIAPWYAVDDPRLTSSNRDARGSHVVDPADGFLLERAPPRVASCVGRNEIETRRSRSQRYPEAAGAPKCPAAV
jgi:hypothetical protein